MSNLVHCAVPFTIATARIVLMGTHRELSRFYIPANLGLNTLSVMFLVSVFVGCFIK